MEENCVKEEILSDNDEEEATNEGKFFLAGHFKTEPFDQELKDEQKGIGSGNQVPEVILPDIGNECPVKQEMNMNSMPNACDQRIDKWCHEDQPCLSEDAQWMGVVSTLSPSECQESSSQPADSTDDVDESNSPVSHESRKRSRSSTPGENSRKRTPASAVRKQLKNSGLPYISSRGKPMEGAKMRRPCACSMDCVHKLPQEKRLQVFTSFWKLGDHDKQWEFIRHNSNSSKTTGLKRSVHRSYFFTVDGEKIPICKFMFVSTLGISDSWIASAYSHVISDEGNIVIPERRGKTKNQRIPYTEAQVRTVEQHVATLPRVPSHYHRQRTYREYFEHGLTLAILAKMYSKWAVEQGFHKSQIATQRQYIDIVTAHFNIAFVKPKKDRCKLCVVMTDKKTARAVQDHYKATYDAHVVNRKRSRDIKEKDKKDGLNNPKVAVLSFSMEKYLNCPKSEDRQFYYVRKLSVFNCTFFNMIKRMGLCVLWHEGIGRKGSNEIASVVMHHIKKLQEEGYEDFRFWSDNCAGQNKNRCMFAMYVYLCVFLKIKITHRYFEPGHTQTECDSIHARIEKAAEKKELLDFEEWTQLIEGVKSECPRYEVERFSTSSIMCFKNLVSQQNWEKDVRGNAINWSKVREVTVDGRETVAGLVRLKYDLCDDSYTTLNVNKHGNIVDLAVYYPPKAYETAIPMPARTVQDLQCLLNSVSIPERYQDFYKNVLDSTTPTEDEGSEMDYETDEELCEGEVLDVGDELRESEENQDEPLEE